MRPPAAGESRGAVRGWDHLYGCAATLTALPAAVMLGGSEWSAAGLVLPHWLLLPASWLGWWMLVSRADRPGPGGSSSRRVLAAWERLDVPLAALVTYAVLFRFSAAYLGVSALILLCFAVSLLAYRRLVRLLPAPALVVFALCLVAVVGLAPRVMRAAVVATVARSHDLTVDHRMKPDGGEINADGLRFRGTPGSLRRDEFVVLFLGDSFTFGWNLPYDASYPYVFESVVSGWRCEQPVRAVNLGWTSSSPLLSLRLLREVGHRYSPDLVVYNLDMTDFHDDLRYEVLLRRSGDFEPDGSQIVERALRTLLPGWLRPPEPAGESAISKLWRGRDPDWRAPAFPGPNDRFFATAHPIARTRDAIERGTMRHLGALDRYAVDVLGAEMVLVLYPRAYQYSTRESPRNWEDARYERLGPYVLEPFRYFEGRQEELPYPVLSLLDDFRKAETFPLFMAGDPHWNRAGAAFAAQRVARGLAARGLLPCSVP